MAERNQITNLAETERRDVKTFILFTTQTKVGIGEPTSGQFPVFRLDLRVDDERLVDNFSFTVLEACPEQKSVVVLFRQIGSGNHGLKLADINKIDDVIEIGSIGEMVLRKFMRNDRQQYWVSIHKDIQVRSRARLQQKAAS